LQIITIIKIIIIEENCSYLPFEYLSSLYLRVTFNVHSVMQKKHTKKIDSFKKKTKTT